MNKDIQSPNSSPWPRWRRVAAPFLPSIVEREAKAQGMTAAAPKRLIVFFTYHGCLTNRWFPAKSHGPLSTAEYMATPTLAPLAPFAPKLLMPRGIRAMNEWSFEGTLGQKNDPHTNPCGSMFTAYPLTPNSTTSSASNPGKFDAKPTGKSLDHIAAAAVNKTSSGQPASAATPGAAPLFMQIGGVQGSATNNMNVISWSDGKRHDLPGRTGSPTHGLQQPHEPVRHGAADEPGHLRGGPRQERHRLRARRPEPALQHQHERGRTGRS